MVIGVSWEHDGDGIVRLDFVQSLLESLLELPMKKLILSSALLALLLGCASAPPESDAEKEAKEQKLREHSQEMQGRVDKAVEQQK